MSCAPDDEQPPGLSPPSSTQGTPIPRRLHVDIRPSAEFWFPDGNIILLAESTTGFKVHRGQLSRQSEVFSDLFSIPPPEQQETIEGAPIIEVSDSVGDLRFFLRALYDGLYFKKPHASDFPFIASVLRLSTKYLVPHLRQRCLQRLECDWPSTLAGWDARERQATDENNRYIPRDLCAHPVVVIQLAIELGVESLLPAALYDLSRYGPSKIMAGAPPSLGSSGKRTSHGFCPAAGVGLLSAATSSSREHGPERNPRLSREMLTRVLRGREATQRFMSTFITKHLHNRPPAPGCLHRQNSASHKDIAIGLSVHLVGTQTVSNITTTATTTTSATTTTTSTSTHPPASLPAPPTLPPLTCPSRLCHESFYFILLNVLRSVGGIACGRDADPLFTLVQAAEMLSRTDFSDGQRQCALRMCEVCKEDFRKCAAKAREEVWKKIPDWFGLNQWNGKQPGGAKGDESGVMEEEMDVTAG